MEQLLTKNNNLICHIADKICKKYGCYNLKDDLISVGNIVVLEKHNNYNLESGATFSTFIHPFLVGAMKRETERYLFPVRIPKDEFQKNFGLLKNSFMSLSPINEENLHSMNVEKEVLNIIYINFVYNEFLKLSFKEREIIGGFFGVFGYEKKTISALAEEFQMKENALQKAKDNAVEMLSYGCFTGYFDCYRQAVVMLKRFRFGSLPKTLGYNITDFVSVKRTKNAKDFATYLYLPLSDKTGDAGLITVSKIDFSFSVTKIAEWDTMLSTRYAMKAVEHLKNREDFPESFVFGW